MEFIIQGKGKIKVSKQDYVAEGGEGTIYRKKNRILKVYTDPTKAIPVDKIKELSAIQHNSVVIPRDPLMSKGGGLVGFTMDFVDGTVPMCKIFTNAFRKANTVQEQSILDLIVNMKEVTALIHSNDCLIVDGNEMNYLVKDTTFDVPYFIDVDSYQTPSFPATAIMPSIRDNHSSDFSELTDWFSFAVICCQLLIGIHPYKGKHPDFGKGSLEARMKANVSIFNPNTRVPSATRDFGLIPVAYKDWFIALFENGDRCPPPDNFGEFKPVAPDLTVISGTNQFEVHLDSEFSEMVTAFTSYYGISITKTSRGIYFDKTLVECNVPTFYGMVTPAYAKKLLVSLKDGQVYYQENSVDEKATGVFADGMFTFKNELFVLKSGKFFRVDVMEISPSKVIFGLGNSVDVMENSTTLLKGLLYSDILGKGYLVLPYENAAMTSLPVKELDGYRVIDGVRKGNVAIIYGYKNGSYDKFLIRFNESYSQYDCETFKDVSQPSLNFIVLDNGLCIYIDESDDLHIFSSSPSSNKKKVIKDKMITSEMSLCNQGNQVRFFLDNRVWSMKMKK